MAERKGRAVHQLVSVLAAGDAIGNFVRFARELLRSEGFESEIFALDGDEASRADFLPASELPARTDASSVTLYHHMFQSRLLPTLEKAQGKKALIFHNITPSSFFADSPVLFGAAELGRAELVEAAKLVDGALCYSTFNAQECFAAGLLPVRRIPFLIDWKAFDARPDEALRARFSDGRRNLLFVGRMDAPNKRVDDLIRIFAAYQRLFDPEARLLLAGGFSPESDAGQALSSLVGKLGAREVHFLGRLSQAELSACFSVASAYVSASEHEGFGVPLIEAMFRGVPVFAYAAGAVEETLGGAGVALKSKEPVEVARVLAGVLGTPSLREALVAGQRARLEQLDRAPVSRGWIEAISSLLEAPAAGPASREPASAPLLICPRFAADPEDPLSRCAAFVLARSPSARLFTLDPSTADFPAPKEDGRVVSWIPDLPVRFGALPPSTALQTAVRALSGPVLFFGDTEPALVQLSPHIRGRLKAWVTKGAMPVSGLNPPPVHVLEGRGDVPRVAGLVTRLLGPTALA